MESAEINDESIRFGPFELKPISGEIRCEGAVVKLSPQPYKVLLFLVRNSGRLVTRKEIQEEIWGTQTFVDFDKGLNLCIAQIREALGDDAQAPKFVETLPRRGYRFIGKVEASTPSSPSTKEELLPVNTARGPRGKGKISVLAGFLGILMVATAAIVYFGWGPTPSGTADKEDKAMLLVLPFQNLNGDPDQDYFSDGLTEEMITRLGSLEPNRLGVVARTTALTYKNAGKDIRRIGQELGVNYLLEGSIRRESGRVRITMQLIRAEDQTHLWSETFERDEQEILEIQKEVASHVASALRLKLLPSSASDIASGKFAKPEAFDAYLKGRYLITKDTPEDLRRSLPYFDQAIAADPQFAPAYVAQVEALVLLADWTSTTSESDQPKAKAAALKAVELDPSFAEGYAALGSVQLWLEWNRDAAEENFRRAIELNPNNPLTRINYGRSLLSRGKMEEADDEIDSALRLDPVSLLTTGLAAYSYLHAGRNDRAIALCQRMLELEPKSPAARGCLFLAYVNTAEYASALDIARQTEVPVGDDATNSKRLENGNPKELVEAQFRKDLGEMGGSAKKGERVWTSYAAWVSIKLGEKDQALGWLDRALNERASFMLYIDIASEWDPLRSDPRFAAIRQRIPS